MTSRGLPTPGMTITPRHRRDLIWDRTRAAVSPSAARGRPASPFQAAAHGIRNVLPGATARPFDRRALLIDAVQELVSISHRDPGVAHPDVELALVLLVGVLRELCALSSHPPCVVGFRSHQLAFCLSASLNLHDMLFVVGVCPIGDSARPIFGLGCCRSTEPNKASPSCVEREKGHATLFLPPLLRRSHRAG